MAYLSLSRIAVAVEYDAAHREPGGDVWS